MWSSHRVAKYKCNKSVLRNLRHRETNGIGKFRNSNRHHKTALCKFFSSIPTRLAFSLKDLVEEHALLEEAHVFLGFNSDGTYVISYTESFGTMDQTGLPSYVYRLHWWLFRFSKKLQKVKSIRLFANEEVMSSLQLYYAEWPHDKTKILIYGCCRDSDNCYITVSAVPPKGPCSSCRVSSRENPEKDGTCYEHGFVAHMKHCSVSSSSAVLNASGLQIDGLIVLNMGHSIGVFSLGLLRSDNDLDNLPLSSIKLATFEEKPIALEADDFLYPYSLEVNNEVLVNPRCGRISVASSAESEREGMVSKKYHSEHFTSFTFSSESQSSGASTQSRSPNVNDWDVNLSLTSVLSQPSSCISLNESTCIEEHCSCTHKRDEDFKSADAADQAGIDPYFDPEPKSIVLLQRDDENTYADPAVEQVQRESEGLVNRCNSAAERSENCCCGYSNNGICTEHDSPVLQNRMMKHGEKAKSKVEKFQRPNKKSSDLNNVPSSKLPVKSSICGYCGLKIKDTRLNNSKKKEASNSAPQLSSIGGSPVRGSSKHLLLSSLRNGREIQDGFLDLNAPTPSPSASESSGSVYCTGDNTSQTSIKSGCCRKTDGIVSFYETLYEQRRDVAMPSAAADDSNAVVTENGLFYGPVTFEGPNGVPLQPSMADVSSPVAYSQHLVLDVEHVIFDVLRTRCYTTYKFGHLIDYDVQIVDTCSNTRSVVILVVALLKVASPKSKSKLQVHHYRLNGNFDSATASNLQQFQFFVCWQLQTGRYEVVAASPLQTFDAKKSGKWDARWVLETRHAIRKACAIPQLPHCAVYVLSNSSVFRGRSLDYLWDVDRVVALKR